MCAWGVPMQTDNSRLDYASAICIYTPGVLCCDSVYHFCKSLVITSGKEEVRYVFIANTFNLLLDMSLPQIQSIKYPSTALVPCVAMASMLVGTGLPVHCANS